MYYGMENNAKELTLFDEFDFIEKIDPKLI